MSKPIYAIAGAEEWIGLVWKTKLGMCVTLQGTINPSEWLTVIDLKTQEVVKDIDVLEVLMDVLPTDKLNRKEK